MWVCAEVVTCLLRSLEAAPVSCSDVDFSYDRCAALSSSRYLGNRLTHASKILERARGDIVISSARYTVLTFHIRRNGEIAVHISICGLKSKNTNCDAATSLRREALTSASRSTSTSERSTAPTHRHYFVMGFLEQGSRVGSSRTRASGSRTISRRTIGFYGLSCASTVLF
ncbi:hypothetical protein C8J57DRAFT_1324073 [Mycena rebaudengoi]|nr:hypothetical protein C8J57DRAFT_1324073 [Mycena rebaudengoi]